MNFMVQHLNRLLKFLVFKCDDIEIVWLDNTSIFDENHMICLQFSVILNLDEIWLPGIKIESKYPFDSKIILCHQNAV